MLENTNTYTVVINYEDRVNFYASDLSKDSFQITVDYYNLYDVYTYADNDIFYIEKGAITRVDSSYYYIDYELNGIENIYNKYEETINARKITNADLIANLDKTTGKGTSDIINLIFSGELFTSFGTALLCVIFALIPLGCLIWFIILSRRTKTQFYKKIFRAIYIISALELAAFAISVILIIVLK